MQAIRMGIVGVGKIARDQHVPCIAANPAFVLEAAAISCSAIGSPGIVADGIRAFVEKTAADELMLTSNMTTMRRAATLLKSWLA